MKEALNLALMALEKVVVGWTEAFAEYKYDSDIPSENQFRDEVFAAITAIKEALAQPEHEKERCVGCDACIDTACGRDECPKGWPKAAQPEQEPVAWKPDRSGKYLTVVYRDVIPGDEVGAIVDHPKCVIMSWSNAVHDVEQLKNTTPPQRTWVGLTNEEANELWESTDSDWELMKRTEAKLKEKNT